MSITKDQAIKYLKLLAKIAIAVLVFYKISQKVDWQQVGASLLEINPLWFLLAVVTFLISKLIAGVRLFHFYSAIGIQAPLGIQLRLYVLGMFYNLFLPGGVGGDGYKVYWLRDREGANVKASVFATLLDRVSGLVGLLLLCLIGAPFMSYDWQYQWAVIPAAVLLYAGFWLALKLFFKAYLSVFWKTNLLSVAVQLLQVVAAFWVMQALGVDPMELLDYMVIFLLSCIAFVIPITPGGVGMREFVMSNMSDLLTLDQAVGVAIGLLFYLAIVGASLTGLYFLVFPGPLKRA